jgi:hypothetical protein
MSDLSFGSRLAIKAFLVPFVVGGFLLASAIHRWLFADAASALSWLVLVLLSIACVLFCGLLAHGILTFFIAWLAPDSPLIAESAISPPTSMSQRLLLPAIRAVGRFARSFAPRSPR